MRGDHALVAGLAMPMHANIGRQLGDQVLAARPIRRVLGGAEDLEIHVDSHAGEDIQRIVQLLDGHDAADESSDATRRRARRRKGRRRAAGGGWARRRSATRPATPRRHVPRFRLAGGVQRHAAPQAKPPRGCKNSRFFGTTSGRARPTPNSPRGDSSVGVRRRSAQRAASPAPAARTRDQRCCSAKGHHAASR